MPKYIEMPIAKLLEHRKNGMSYNKIAKLYKVSSATVMKRIKEYEKQVEIAEAESLEQKLPDKKIEEVKEKVDKKPIKKATTPWNAEDNPWHMDLLKLKKKRDGFRVRFFRGNDDSIEKRLQQGWTVANCTDYGLKEKVVGEEGKLDSTVRRRELILMEMPEELAKQRDAYVREKTDRQTAMKSADALRAYEEVKKQGMDARLIVEKDTLSERLGR